VKNIKFRTSHYRFNGEFSHFSFWGTIHGKGDYSKKSFASRGEVAGTVTKTDDFYTGIEDSEGKEIYENDIMSHPDFKDGAKLRVYFLKGCTYLEGWDCVNTDLSKGKVIGSTHQQLN
jgi:hypothetical protein